MFEIFRGPLGPFVSIVKSLANGSGAIIIIVFLLFFIWYRGPSRASAGVGYPAYSTSDRMAAYEELWRKEESELWDWLEERVGVERLISTDGLQKDRKQAGKTDAKLKIKQRQKILGGKDVKAKLQEERMSEREMDEAIRITQERLHVLKDVVEKRKSKQDVRPSEEHA